MSTTLATILKDLVREYGLGRSGLTTSGGSTTTIIDSSNFAGPLPGGMFPNGSPVRVTSGTDIGQNTYKSGIDPSTGTITVSPALTGTPGSSASFIVSNVVDHCDRLVEAINRALTRRISRWLKVPLTDVPDGDFLGTTVSDHWAATNATLTYQTLSMVNGIAQRVLQVVTTAANGFGQSDPIPVMPLETRNFMLFMRNANSTVTTVNTAAITIRDLTNGANITPTFTVGTATSASHAFITVKGQYSIPAGCSQIAYQLGAQENTATVQFACLVDNGSDQRTFFAQPHLATEDDISTLYLASPGTPTSGPEDMAFSPISDDGYSINNYGWGLAFDFTTEPPMFPMFYDEYSFFTPLSADTDTTDADEEIVILGAAIELFKMLVEQNKDNQVSRYGRRIPTHWEVAQQRAEALWQTPRLQRLIAPRRVSIRRTYRRAITA